MGSATRSATRGTTTTSTRHSTRTGTKQSTLKKSQLWGWSHANCPKKETVDQTKDRLLFYSVQRGARVGRKGECKKVNSCVILLPRYLMNKHILTHIICFK